MNASIKSTLASINALVIASLSYADALVQVRTEFQAGRLDRNTARIALAKAYAHHKPAYKTQVDSETGKPIRNTALEKQVNRDLANITSELPGTKGKTGKPKQDIAVPAAIAALAAKLVKACSAYEGSARLLATAVAQAKQQ